MDTGTAREDQGRGRRSLDQTGNARLAANRSGVWEIRWREQGRSRGLSTRTKDRSAAEKVIRSFLKTEQTLALASAGGVTIGDMLDGYEAAARKRDVGVTTLACIKRLQEHFGAYVVSEITSDAVEDYCEARGMSDLGIATGTVRRELAVLVACLRWAARRSPPLIAAGGVPLIELPAPGAARVVWLDEAQDAKLFEVASRVPVDVNRAGLFVCIGLDTGARRSAIQRLTWDRVDLVRGTVDFRDPAMKVTKKRRVMTPITDRLMPVLRHAYYYYEQGPTKFVLGHGGEIRKSFEGFIRDHAGRQEFGHVTAHVLRHTRITLLLRAGVALWDVSKLVGASPVVLDAVYGHHRVDDRLRAEANRRAA